jgi:GT2 family glycosyltransferase
MTKPPRASVVIPAYYSCDTLADCLDSLRAQTWRDFEIVLVNSSPEDTTARIVSRYPEVRFEQSPVRLYPHAARNRAAGLAEGELLIFLDPDCRARPDWLERLVAAQDGGHPVVGGGMEVATTRWFERGVHLCKFSWALSGLPPGPHPITPSANVCYHRRVWEAAGPLDGELWCGDAVLSWRAAARGFAPWFEPRAVVEHRHAGSWGSFWQERFTRGQEFAAVRMAFFRWSRTRAGASAILAPLLLLLVLLRAGGDALRASSFGIFLWTLPVQLVGQLGWVAGETLVHGRYALQGPGPAV